MRIHGIYFLRQTPASEEAWIRAARSSFSQQLWSAKQQRRQLHSLFQITLQPTTAAATGAINSEHQSQMLGCALAQLHNSHHVPTHAEPRQLSAEAFGDQSDLRLASSKRTSQPLSLNYCYIMGCNGGMPLCCTQPTLVVCHIGVKAASTPPPSFQCRTYGILELQHSTSSTSLLTLLTPTPTYSCTCISPSSQLSHHPPFMSHTQYQVQCAFSTKVCFQHAGGSNYCPSLTPIFRQHYSQDVPSYFLYSLPPSPHAYTHTLACRLTRIHPCTTDQQALPTMHPHTMRHTKPVLLIHPCPPAPSLDPSRTTLSPCHFQCTHSWFAHSMPDQVHSSLEMSITLLHLFVSNHAHQLVQDTEVHLQQGRPLSL